MSSKDVIHNPPECLIFQFNQIFKGEQPHPIVSTGTPRTGKSETAGQSNIKVKQPLTVEVFAAHCVEIWEKEHDSSKRNEGVVKPEEKTEQTELTNHNQAVCTKARTTQNKERAICTTKTKNERHGTTKSKNMVQGRGKAPKKIPWFFDDANMKILEAIANGHIQEHIIKHSIISKNATISRLKRMVQEKLLEKTLVQDEIDINKAHIVYKQTKACTKLLIGDDEQAQHQDFRSHEQKYKFELIQDAENIKLVNSIPCVNMRRLKNKVIFKDFYRDNCTIRLTSKHICFFATKRLEADGIDNLNIKYTKLAEAEAGKFAREYGLRYNPVPTIYQPSTFDCISAEPLAQVLRERGNFNIKAAGIEARVDPSDRGIESNEENAREIEYRLFKMPAIMKDLQQAIITQTAALGKLVEEHKESIVFLQGFLKTLGDSQLKMTETITAMSGDIKELTKIFKPKEGKEEKGIEPQRLDDMVMYG